MRSDPTSFVYSRDIGESDIFQDEQDMAEAKGDKLARRTENGLHANTEDDAISGSPNKKADSEHDDSESENDTNQGIVPTTRVKMKRSLSCNQLFPRYGRVCF